MSSAIRMRTVVFIGNVLFSLATASTLFTNSSVIEKAFGEQMVSFTYAASAALTILILSKASALLRTLGNKTFFLLHGALYTVAILTLIIPVPASLRLLGFTVYLASGNILIYSFNVFFEHVTTPANRGKSRGLYLFLGNLGYLAGPILGAVTIDYARFEGTYVLGLLLLAVTSILLFWGLAEYTDPVYTVRTRRIALGHALRKSTLMPVLASNFLLQFFYAWMVIYTPIYLTQHLGISWETVGSIFTVMLLPFVLLDYPLGRLADRLGSEKELATIGFCIMILCTLLLARVPDLSIIGVTIILFFSRVGAATVEAMTEIHFYKTASEKDPRLLSAFSDLRPLAYILAPLLGYLVVSGLPFRALFAVLAGLLSIGVMSSMRMDRERGWWKRSHKD